jgi:hypothetical protein
MIELDTLAARLDARLAELQKRTGLSARALVLQWLESD